MKLLITIAIVIALILLATYLRRRGIDESSPATSTDPRIDARLAAFVAAVHSVESEEDPAYVRALDELQSDPERSVTLLRDSLRGAEKQPGLLQDLAMAAAALAHPAALPLLIELAERPLRPDASLRVRETDSILRAIAVDGIEALGGKELAAVEALVSLARSPDRSAQTAAVVALTHNAWGLRAAETLRDTLPPERRFLLEVRRTPVHAVPQVSDPTRHLAGPARSRDQRP